MIPNDIIHKILCYLPIHDIYSIESTFALKDDFWKMKAIHEWGEEFWNKAHQRPTQTSKPLSSWKEELERIETFQQMIRKFGQREWNHNDFYQFWNIQDALFSTFNITHVQP